MKTLVIASGNAGKIREFQGLLQALPVSVQPQPEGLEVEETGTTFAANARLKAQAVAAATGEWALADDSGLSVDALDGAPGVHSARYAPTDPERIARLLKALNGSDQRQAYFCAALCVAAPDGTILLEVEGRCDGLITAAPREIRVSATTDLRSCWNRPHLRRDAVGGEKAARPPRQSLQPPGTQVAPVARSKLKKNLGYKGSRGMVCTVRPAADEVHGHRHDHGLQRADRGRSSVHRSRLGLGPDLCESTGCR